MKGKFKEKFYLIKNDFKNLIISFLIFTTIWIFATAPSKEDWFQLSIFLLNVVGYLTILEGESQEETNKRLYGRILPISVEEYQGGLYLSQLVIFISITIIIGILALINKSNFLKIVLTEFGFLTIIGGILLFLSNISNQKAAAIIAFLIAIVTLIGFAMKEELLPFIGEIYNYEYLYAVVFALGIIIYLISYFISVKLVEGRTY